MEANNKLFKVLAAALGLLGLLATTAENFRQFHSALEEYYWYVLGVAWVLSIAAAWPQPLNTRVGGPQDTYQVPLTKFFRRYSWLILISLLFLGVGFYRYYVTYTPEPGKRPFIGPGEVRTQPSRSEWSFATVYAQSQPVGPRILQFHLIPEKTSYIKTDNQHDFYDLPKQTLTRFVAEECEPNFNPTPALKALRTYAKSAGKESLLKFIESEAQLKRLVKDHPQRVRELIPSKAEQKALNESDYAAIISWMRDCVGILFPVFIVVLENPLDQDLVVLSVRYNYHNIVSFKGVEGAAPLFPAASYVHKLDPVRDRPQQIELVPGFNIPARRNGSFELQLWTETAGKYFLMDIEFVTNRGSVRTNRFTLSVPVTAVQTGAR